MGIDTDQMTPLENEKFIQETYDKMFTPESMKAITGMPEHKVRMFDRTSRMSDSITDRILDQDALNDTSRLDPTKTNLIDQN